MVLGVDIGGTHISVAIIDENVPDQVQNIYTMEISNTLSSDLILDSWIGVIELAIDNLGNEKLKGIGIAMPGPFDYEKGIFPDKGKNKFEMLSNFNLKGHIIKKLNLKSSVSVRFHNDAACFGIGEAWVGELVSCDKAIAITLGTGLGATFLDKGIPILEGKGVPLYGELYHLPFGNDIADTSFSTVWFQKRYKELTNEEIIGVKELIRFEKDNIATTKIFKEFSENLAIFLTPWLLDFEAEAIVIGGNISNAWTFFIEDLIQTFNKLDITIPIYKSKLRESAALIGAARLIDDDFFLELSDEDKYIKS
ncbi:glucokinase [Aquimarina sp. MAR_2010_214]|uniref:ROK family protein n=1 Tax=Aquimarina sp. MAR_2010_214 TaxID=1250026 RepID=UPI000C70D8A3|nr:ROK family protein [Aquimarina sp. MAR_2010_214]PKV50166.1 glucokinase [Aquimarina sp. MAR_2010_214]